MKHLPHMFAWLLGLLLATAVLPAHAKPVQAAAATHTDATTDADAVTTFSLLTDREPVVLLDGQWRFQIGDDPRWADPGFDDTQWPLVQSGSDWDAIGYHNLDGTAWYRFHVILPPGEEQFSLRLPVIYTCYQVFVNGKLMLTEGKLPPNPGTYRSRPVVLDLPSGLRTEPQKLTVALRIWHSPLWSRYRHGGLQGSAEIGRSDLLHEQFDRQEQAYLWQFSDDFDLGALDLLAFAVAAALFLTRQSEREFLWFALLVLGQGAFHLIRAWDFLHSGNLLGYELVETAFQTLFLASALLFFRTLFHGKWTNAFVFALVCCGLSALVAPLTWMGALSVAQENLLTIIFLLPVFGWILLFVRQQSKRRQPDARLLRFPIAFLIWAHLYGQFNWTMQTFGYVWFSSFTLRWRHPFYFTLEDLAETIFLLAMLVILLRRFALRSREQDRVESEIEAARSVQQVLVPETLPRIPGLSICTAYHPAQEVGGDFFQILPLSSGETVIVIGDVAGKGLPAALQVSLAVGTLRTLVEVTTSPAQLLAGLNRSLQGRSAGFTTCLALHFSADRTVLTFANAGHIAPYVNGFELRTEPNLPLGLVPDVIFDEARYDLSAGDHLTVLTDGVPEAMHQRELFGFERTGLLSTLR